MKKADRPVVVGIGELLWDMLPAGKRAGGAPVNFVYHATRQGADGYAVSAVGNDSAGDEIAAELAKNGIRSCLTRNGYPTGYVEVELNGGIPVYQIAENVAWDHLRATDEAVRLAERADAVCFGTLASRGEETKATVKTLLAHTPAEALRFFDVNLRGGCYSRFLIEELLAEANAFKVNDEEFSVLKRLFGVDGGEDEICRRFIERYGLKYMILTAGEKYSAVYAGNEKSYLPTPKVDVADTVGAGDSFSGAFVYNILTGKSLREAHAAAVETAAFVSTRSGAWPRYEKGG